VELEKQLEHEEFWLKAKQPEVPNLRSEDQEYAFSRKIKNLLALSKLALQTDSTRVITFSMDWIYGAIKVPGATSGWHTLSHHAAKPVTQNYKRRSRIEGPANEMLRNCRLYLTHSDSNASQHPKDNHEESMCDRDCDMFSECRLASLRRRSELATVAWAGRHWRHFERGRCDSVGSGSEREVADRSARGWQLDADCLGKPSVSYAADL
jgi:hypothetical protein